MKIKFFILISLSIIAIIGCKKKNADNQVINSITFLIINKTVLLNVEDSIIWDCRPLIFKILINKQTHFSAIIIENVKPFQCYESISCITDSGYNVRPLNKNEMIFSKRTWTNANELGLLNFAGKGEKFIGFRSSSTMFQGNYYGWIKIILTKNSDTLKLISTAYRDVPDRSICAGESK